jgi:hypothetical protein
MRPTGVIRRSFVDFELALDENLFEVKHECLDAQQVLPTGRSR